MGKLYKPKIRSGERSYLSPRWYLDFTDHQGKRVRRPAFESKKESADLLKELEGKALRIKQGLEKIPDKCPPLAQLVKDYLADQKPRLATNTYKDYSRDLRHLFEGSKKRGPWLKGCREMADLTPQVLSRMQGKVLEEGLSPRTANRLMAVLGGLLTWAIGHHDLNTTNPIRKVKALPDRSEGASRAFEDEELARLLETSTGDDRDCWTLAVDLGVRRGELAALLVSDVQERSIYIRPEITKTKKGRTIPLSKRAQEIIARRIDGRDPGEPLLVLERTRTSGDSENTYKCLLPRLKRCLAEAGLNDPLLKVHSFRKTFVTRLLARGCNPKTVQALVGHSTLHMTMNVYAKVRSGDLQKAIDLLAE